MKTLKPEDLFFALQNRKMPSSVIIQGDDAFLLRELRNGLRQSEFEVQQTEFKKTGPESAQEDLSMGGSLFSSASLLWVTKTASLSGWKSEAKKTWERIRSRADGHSFFIIVQVPVDKRMNWSALGMDVESKFQIDDSQRLHWVKRMNASRGSPLSLEKLQFLVSAFDEPLLAYDNWIELWALGGDAWAEVALGWSAGARQSSHRHLKLEPNENPAYSWVDCVLKSDSRRGLALLDYLLEQGQEPLQLMGLLNKSVRILAALERGDKIVGQPEFLLGKLRQVQRAQRNPRRGQILLRNCADVDRRLKTSSTNARALLANLLV